jgi:predicted transcriptional regulator
VKPMPKITSMMSKSDKQKYLIEKKSVKLCEDIREAVFRVYGKNYLTQTEFAKISGLNQSTLSKRLKNPMDLELGELVKIITAFPEIREHLANSISSL